MFRNTHASVGKNQGQDCGVERAWTSLSETRALPICAASPRAHTAYTRLEETRPRGGISLTEVLIAMGILTVGLLGVASVFPVGSYYMQQGDIAERGSAIGQAAFNDALARGTLNPENWLIWQDTGVVGVATPPGVSSNTFTRPFAQMLRQQKAYHTSAANAICPACSASDLQKKTAGETAGEFGSVFIIDPLGVASVAMLDDSTRQHVGGTPAWARIDMRSGGVFPASSLLSLALPSPYSSAWWPWVETGTINSRWPIRRVSLKQPFALGISKPLDAELAQRQFASIDDLSIDLPPTQDKPSILRWGIAGTNLNGDGTDLNGDGNNKNDVLTRQSRGDYSWMIAVSPTTTAARDALATNPSNYSYEVSTVVFHKRPLGGANPTSQADLKSNAELLQQNERGARASIVSTGLNGGEVLLTRFKPGTESGSTAPYEPDSSPFDILKTGQWIMLCGPHPNSTDTQPMMTARWYRVLAIEGKDIKLDASGNPTFNTTDPERRLVSLRGPEWPWLPATDASGNTDLANNAHLSNSLYACIPAGAVAVHSKTIHLGGNSVWSGGESGFGTAAPVGPLYTP